jgi:hypothetical protein
MARGSRRRRSHLQLLSDVFSHSVSTLVLGCEEDPMIPIECQEDLVAALPQHLVRFERFPNCGHSVDRRHAPLAPSRSSGYFIGHRCRRCETTLSRIATAYAPLQRSETSTELSILVAISTLARRENIPVSRVRDASSEGAATSRSWPGFWDNKRKRSQSQWARI